jgi:serine/threonine protein kinase/Tol biopolymer transport system component
MPVSIGQRFGPYEVVARIGAGGMGEVYRARDTKLKRDVALKVLPEAFLNETGRLARFQREAEVLASLNHSNIAAIYGLEERALVMELVEGVSPTGPMPFEEAWKIASQIADALEYAHEKAIVHRDLKPANVKVTPDGVVKLLDFGLAKALSPEESRVIDSPTLTMSATVAGVILGTAAYMSPEQAKGKRVDKRADIWSWGVVLCELLTGERMFEGEDIADTLAQVLTKQPDLEHIPPHVRKLLRRCLEKDPKQRLRDIGEARYLLEEAESGYAAPVQRVALRHKAGWIAAGVLLMVAAGLGLVTRKHLSEELPHVVKFSIQPPDKGDFAPTNAPSVAVSPDGRRVAFVAIVEGRRELWVRDLDAPEPRMMTQLPSVTFPFWAPDSRRLAFFDGGKLKTIDVTGGPTVTIAQTGAGRGGTWNSDDVIIFSRGTGTSGLLRVAAGGGTPAQVTELDKSRNETMHVLPWFLPDGRHFLYLANSTDAEKADVWVGDLTSQTRKQVMIGNTRAIYVAPGYLLFVRDRTLIAQPFDTRKLATTGDAVPVAEQLDTTVGAPGALGYFSASQNGVLTYTSSGVAGRVQLTWFSRSGKKLDTAGAAGDWEAFSLSPDGESVVAARRDPQSFRFDLWKRDLAHGAESRLTSTGNNRYPVWSSDGTQIYFMSDREGDYKVYRKAANGTGPEEVVEAAFKAPLDASRDGLYLIEETSGANPKTGNDIWVFPLFGDRKPIPYVQTEFHELRPRLSPDGQWLAYQSNESRPYEVYVESFPQKGGRWQVSNNGGMFPVWSRNGRELYYYSLDKQIMAVQITPGTQFRFGLPKPLFEVRISTYNTSFEVSKDGRFLLPALVEQQGSTPMRVVLNWPEMLKRR